MRISKPLSNIIDDIMIDAEEISRLEHIAKDIKIGVISSIRTAGSGHPGGSLSCVDILACLYFQEMKENDKFHLSKGHAAPTLYEVLKLQGKVDVLKELRRLGGLDGHPSNETLGIHVSSGSLGQGASVAAGMSLGKLIRKNRAVAKLRAEGKNDYVAPGRVYCLVGDGELQEPEPWAAMMSAAHFNQGNYCLIVDYNGLQIDGQVDKVMSLGDLDAKAKAFGFSTYTFDGHDFKSIAEAFSMFRLNVYGGSKPTMLIAKTVKGKGVSFMEGKAQYHGAMTYEEGERAMEELR